MDPVHPVRARPAHLHWLVRERARPPGACGRESWSTTCRIRRAARRIRQVM